MPIQSKIIEHNGIKYRVDVEIEPILEFNIINALKYQIKKHFNKPPKKRHHNKKSTKKNPKLANRSNKNDDIESIASKLADELKNDKLFNSYEYPIEYLSDWDIKNVRKVRGIVYELMSNSSFKSLVNNNTFEMLYDPYGIIINIDLLKDPSIKSYIAEYLNSTQKLNKLLTDAYDEKNKDNEELWNEIRKLDDQCMDDLYAGLDKYEEDKIRKNINSLKDNKPDDFEVYTDISGGNNTSTRVTFTINF